MGDTKSPGGHFSGPRPVDEFRQSSRIAADVDSALADWLQIQIPEATSITIELNESSSANGMSNETFLFSARWASGDTEHQERLVARVAPHHEDIPIFRSYDLGAQFRVMRLVAGLSQVPVPEVLWLEEDPAVLGSPFFVMRHVEGIIPSDVPPYNGDSWLSRLPRNEQRALQDNTIKTLAELHAIPEASATFAFLDPCTDHSSALHRHVTNSQAWYDFAKADGARSSLVERGFRWLAEHWPRSEGPAVLSWGDARIGNIIYAERRPVAVLDWEMAGIGPRELDLSWLAYSHRVYEDLVVRVGLPGMPHFLDIDDVAHTYASSSGYDARDLDFFLVYAAVRWAIVFLRTGTRRARLHGTPMPEDPDDLLLNRPALETMLTA